MKICLNCISETQTAVTKKALIRIIDSLSAEVLMSKSSERQEIRSLSFSDIASIVQLRDWLDLSLNHSVPSSLLILSRYLKNSFTHLCLLSTFRAHYFFPVMFYKCHSISFAEPLP